tara:strand:- start:576 stop:716 length:141 start_codon:yes stop_codon:yes gene_type:complete
MLIQQKISNKKFCFIYLIFLCDMIAKTAEKSYEDFKKLKLIIIIFK